MIRNRDILNCLPMLASVLGNRYGVKVRIGGDKAYTNGKVIQIPALPLDCGKTAISLAKGYIDHEAAHIRYTDFSCFRKAAASPLVRHLCNSIEDWRVEKCLSELYPGCKANLSWLVKHIFLEGTEEAGSNPASSVLNYVLLCVRSWDVSELGEQVEGIRSELENVYPGLTARLDSVLERVEKDCPSTQAALDYALELAAIIRKYEPPKTGAAQRKRTEKEAQGSGVEPESNENTPSGGGKEEETEDSSQDTLGKEVPVEGENDGGVGNELDNLTTSTTAGGSNLSQETDALRELKSLADKGEDELPKGLGELIAEKLSGSSCGNHGNAIEVASCFKRQTEKLPDEEKRAALRSSNALRQRLAGLLQAQELRHNAPARGGKLDTDRLYRLSCGNPRIFAKKDTVKGKKTAVHILLDASSSMENAPIKLARQACYAAAKALYSIKGVNPAVTVFPAGGCVGVYPIMEHGQKLTDRFMVDAIGGTPLAPALWWVAQTLYPLPESRKIVLVITDGDPDNVPAAIEAIGTIRKLGMEIYGVGINLERIKVLLPDRSRVIRTLSELAPALFDLLQEALLKGGHA